MKGLNVPAGQAVQAAKEVLPVEGLNDPSGQAAQVDLPLDGLYVPAGQA